MATLAPAPQLAPSRPRKFDALAETRIGLCYLWRHHRLPAIDRPARFTEWVQWRKLHDRDPRQTLLMDKLAAKELAARILGTEWVTPTLWRGAALPDREALAYPAIVKARHGCNQYAVLRSKPADNEWARLRHRAQRWMDRPYGGWLDEWAYRDVPRGLLAEPLIGGGGPLPVDYKIYVFGGAATHIQVHLDRGSNHRWVLHDRSFTQLAGADAAIVPPRSLAAMLEAAERLACGFDFLRVDFYEVDGKPRFGEFCLYPGSGLDRFAADWIDHELGGLWQAARAARANLCECQA